MTLGSRMIKVLRCVYPNKSSHCFPIFISGLLSTKLNCAITNANIDFIQNPSSTESLILNSVVKTIPIYLSQQHLLGDLKEKNLDF